MSPKEFCRWHEDVWNWKSQGVLLEGPFASVEEAGNWMAENGAFTEGD